MLGDASIMGALFGLLEQPRPLDCMLTGYFSRVITGLLQRRARDVLRYLKVGTKAGTKGGFERQVAGRFYRTTTSGVGGWEWGVNLEFGNGNGKIASTGTQAST